MARFMALDYGSVRIGVAFSDSQKKIAQMLEPPIPNNKNILSAMATLKNKYEIEKIIIGLPQGLNGTEGKAALTVKNFANKTQRVLKIPVELVDERYTTKQASRILASSSSSSKTRKSHVDNLSAQLLLEQYLDNYNKLNN